MDKIHLLFKLSGFCEYHKPSGTDFAEILADGLNIIGECENLPLVSNGVGFWKQFPARLSASFFR